MNAQHRAAAIMRGGGGGAMDAPGLWEVFRLGFEESDGDIGRTWADDQDMNEAYDAGRHVGAAFLEPIRSTLAAAPDLLEAAKAALALQEALPARRCRWCGLLNDQGHDNDCIGEALRAAIAKAEGRTE